MTFHAENANEFIDRQDVTENLEQHKHNFGSGDDPYSTLTGRIDIDETDRDDFVGEEEFWSTKYQGVASAIGEFLTGKYATDDSVVEVVTNDRGHSGPNSAHLNIIEDEDQERNFQQAYDRLSQDFNSNSDTSAATGIALASIESALTDEVYALSEPNSPKLHAQPADNENGYSRDVARDAVSAAFEPKSLTDKMRELI
ncbi:MAG: hypothetical protein R6V35_04385 [Candidatus Nanohaloarchaea archaeon]